MNISIKFLISSLLVIFISPSFVIAEKGIVLPVDRPSIDVDLLERKIHELINMERLQHKLNSLTWNNDLSWIARGHSEDMALKKYFAHESPDGLDFSKRYEKSKFDCSVNVGNFIYKGAENIYMTTHYESITTVNNVQSFNWKALDEIAHGAVSGWMNSQGHRKNILTPYFNSEGIGVYVSDEGKVYITQNFC